jgi:glyoxylase I family protein
VPAPLSAAISVGYDNLLDRSAGANEDRHRYELEFEGARMNPIRIRAIDHVVFRVADLERSKRFYCGVLGCTEEKWQEEFGLLQLRAGDCLIDLVTLDGRIGREGGGPPAPDGRNVDHVCVRLAEFDEAALGRHLRAHGIEPGGTVRRYGAEGYGRSIYISDPDGNTVELKAPPDPPEST